MTPPPPALPFSYIRALDIGKQSRAGALGLIAYDHFISIDAEVEVVWKQKKRSWSTWLYIFNRFFPLIWLSLDTVPFAPGGIVSSKVCITYLSTDDVVTLLATISVQTILQMRAPAYGSPCGCVLEIAIMIVFVGVTMAHISHLPVISTSTGCYYSGIFSISALFWLPALVFEPILCLLVVWKAWGDDIIRWLAPRASSRSKDALAPGAPPIVKAMARDSIFFELLVNTTIWSHFNRYINVIMPWSCALPSILGSRLFIHMRQLMLHTEEGSQDDSAPPATLDAFEPATRTLTSTGAGTDAGTSSEQRSGGAV
ncbi:hypothetical protein BC834DRAFT_883779 [Gloeopeniophorella convolvens]|nr:hypothetical protein BC834DRAFT_883779 [Gloeopeniophorella convolvens]